MNLGDLSQSVCARAYDLYASSPAKEDARLVLADTMLCAAYRAQHGGATAGAPGEVRIWGTDILSAPVDAVYRNAYNAHFDDWDSVHYLSTGHPGVVVWPVIFAVANECDSTTKDALTAFMVAHEVMCVLGTHFGKQLISNSVHPSSVLAAIAGAAGAAWLHHGNPEAIDAAMTLASLSASGATMGFGTAAKPFQLATAASVAWRAAHEGAQLSSERQLWVERLKALAGGEPAGSWPDCENYSFGSVPGAAIMPSHIKHLPSCAYFDEAIHELEQARVRFSPEKWRVVEMEVPTYMIEADRYERPESLQQTRFSLRYLLGHAWAGTLVDATLDEEFVANRENAELGRDIVLKQTAKRDRDDYAECIPARIIFRSRDGEHGQHSFEYTGGRPQASWETLNQKFTRHLGDEVVGATTDFARRFEEFDVQLWNEVCK